MKKFLGILLVLFTALLLTACSNNSTDMWEVLPEIPVTNESKFEYKYDSGLGGVRVTDYTGGSSKVRIPDKLGGDPVVGVDLRNCGVEITELIMPNSVEKFHLPSASENGEQNMSGSLQYVNIPVNAIYSGEFMDYVSLKVVYIPNGAEKIGAYAFCGCTSLENVIIPDSVTDIGESAFNSTGLTSVTIPDGVTKIKNDTFKDCKSLASVTIPNSVTDIDDYAFAFCKSLKSIDIPKSVTDIGELAFCQTGLTSVTIPDSVTKIRQNTFNACGSLTSINVDSGNSKFCSVDGIIYKKDNENLTLFRCPYGKSGEISLPGNVTKIGDSAFETCTSITGVTLPDSVTEIGPRAFSLCRNLISITIPDSVVKIGAGRGDRAFLLCDNLANATYKGKSYDYAHIEELYKAINGG